MFAVDFAVETVRITDALLQQPYHQEVAAQHQIAETFRIIKSHGEQILALPKCAVLLGTSPSAPFEFWSFGCNILALQGHCEFDCETTLKKIHAPLTASKRLSPEQSELSAQALLNIRPDDAFVTDLIKHWWRQPAPTTPVDQQPSGHPSSKLPSALNVQGGPPNSVSMAEGHFQFGQSLAPFVAGHPQTSGIDTPTDKLLGDAGQGPPTGARTHSTPILHQGLSNPSPIVPGAAPERTNCSVQDDTATAAAAAADQHADVAEPPPEQSASSLLPERQSPDQASFSSFCALQSSGQTFSALPADQTENIRLRLASSSLVLEHNPGQSSPFSGHITAGSQELPVSSAQASDASQHPSSSGHVCHTSQHPSSSSHQAQAGSHSSSASHSSQHLSSSSGQAQEAGNSLAASVHHAHAAGLEHASSSSYTPPIRHQSLAEPSTGWQHYRQSGTRGTQTQSDRDAAGDEDEGGAGLKGWVEEGRQHEEQLTQKVCGHAASFDIASVLASLKACLHTIVLLAD
ncbi:TPA: hypothetical protein ACH3X1_002700 [Trebouxia sp. C0004]